MNKKKIVTLLFSAMAGLASTSNTANIFITDGEPLISAHRSGAGIAPEETVKALDVITQDKATQVDLIETDVHLTRDGKLVHLHDPTLNRTSNASQYFKEPVVLALTKTYDQLRKLNMGEKFVAPDGSTPYKGLRGAAIPDNIRILELNDFLNYLEGTPKRYLVSAEIKNMLFSGFKAADELYATLKEHNMLDNTIIASFNQEVLWYVDRYPGIHRSAGPVEVVDFFVKSVLNLPLGNVHYEVLQLPYYPILGLLGFGSRKFNEYAQRHGVAVHYWTVNKAKDIDYLSRNGADSIISDYPDIATQVIYNPLNYIGQYLNESLLVAPVYYGTLLSNQLEHNRQTANNIFSLLIAGYQQEAPQKGTWSFFLDDTLSNQYGKAAGDTGSDLSQTFNLGFLYRAPSKLAYGVMLSAGKNSREPTEHYHFKEKPLNFSLFGYLPLNENFWLAGTLAAGQTKLTDIRRTTSIKRADFVSTIADQKSRSLTADLTLGYHFNLNETTLVSPYLTYSFDHVTLNAADEEGLWLASPLRLHYDKIKLNNSRAKAGVVLAKNTEPVNYSLTLNYNYNLSHDTKTLKVRAPDSSLVLAEKIPVTDKKWLELGGNANIKLTKNNILYVNVNFKKAPSIKVNSTLTLGFKHDFN